MKATGVVRRLDDLGRLVIPKEIRKQYRLREGDNIEIFTDEERIIIQKFDALSKYTGEIVVMCDVLKDMLHNTVLFIQDEKTCLQPRKLKPIFFRSVRQVRKTIDFDSEYIFEDDSRAYGGRIFPVVADSDWYGAFVIVYDNRSVSKSELNIAEAFAQLLTRQQQQ